MTKTTKAAELLLEYKQITDNKILILRKEACELAAKSRELSKLISLEQIEDIKDQKDADIAWSLGDPIVQQMLQESK